MPNNQNINFIDLKAQQEKLQPSIDNAIKNVLNHGKYILGPEVNKFEEKLKNYLNCKHAISCANGTDALTLLLMAKKIKSGDAVFVPTFSFAATAEVVAHLNAIPIFVDIEQDSFNISLNSLKQGINQAKKLQLKPTGIIAVDLFGLPADYDGLHEIANENNLWVIADSAQSFGASINGFKIGAHTQMTATSFFPSKPLGCYGDGGCVFTQCDEIAQQVRSLRAHGTGEHRYDFINIGLNSRLDSIQAAILIEKLKIFDIEIQRRQEIACFYNSELKNVVQTPQVPENYQSAWALYTLKVGNNYQQLQDMLKQSNIPAVVYYNKPLHFQEAYKKFPRAANNLKISEELSQKVISIPMHPYLTDNQLDYIVDTIKKVYL